MPPETATNDVGGAGRVSGNAGEGLIRGAATVGDAATPQPRAKPATRHGQRSVIAAGGGGAAFV
jgi:hypothetical protein